MNFPLKPLHDFSAIKGQPKVHIYISPASASPFHGFVIGITHPQNIYPIENRSQLLAWIGLDLFVANLERNQTQCATTCCFPIFRFLQHRPISIQSVNTSNPCNDANGKWDARLCGRMVVQVQHLTCARLNVRSMAHPRFAAVIPPTC